MIREGITLRGRWGGGRVSTYMGKSYLFHSPLAYPFCKLPASHPLNTSQSDQVHIQD